MNKLFYRFRRRFYIIKYGSKIKFLFFIFLNITRQLADIISICKAVLRRHDIHFDYFVVNNVNYQFLKKFFRFIYLKYQNLDDIFSLLMKNNFTFNLKFI
jgi:hypothetical protein